jgi:PGDYG protein
MPALRKRAMLELKNIDLTTDPAAASYVKTEVVTVTFARQDGELLSLEGPNRYAVGDALVTGLMGSRWSVSRQRFDLKYEAVPPTLTGDDGRYRAKPLPVLAKQIPEAFTAARSAGGDVLRGNAGDWLLQYAPGDFGVADQSRFAQVYRKVA